MLITLNGVQNGNAWDLRTPSSFVFSVAVFNPDNEFCVGFKVMLSVCPGL